MQTFRLRVTIDLEGRAFVTKVDFFDLGGKSKRRGVIQCGDGTVAQADLLL